MEPDRVFYYFKRWGTELRLKRRYTAHRSCALLSPISVHTALKETHIVNPSELWGSKSENSFLYLALLAGPAEYSFVVGGLSCA